MLQMKGTGERDGEEMQFIMLGLRKINVQRLQEGQPIVVKGDDLAIEYDIYIWAGDTEESMAAELEREGFPKSKPLARKS